MTYLLQSLIFEKMVERNSRDTTGLCEIHLNKNVEIFRDPKLTVDKTNPNKMMYDSFRILGLVIYTELNKTFIKLHHAAQNQPLIDVGANEGAAAVSQISAKDKPL